MDRFGFRPKLRCAPVSNRAPSRRPPLSATAVSAQLLSSAIGCMSDVVQKVPMLENIQYQNAMIKQVPPHAAT
ncbi:hypothetical protein MHIB_28280 [Mycolicibacter hiberniae]|uniref:Uncharacterized protein n=1 Tax=Mycolicibacter hiberniae TaxID=29314 RepID=A0A7I7X4X4_9MYCO|nr:hypothetical protein MHIB_28280 [Mycolicibacter hiberniae]